MRSTPTMQRIQLAVESPDLEEAARAYCQSLFPGSDIEMRSPGDFSSAGGDSATTPDLRVMMIHADRDGEIDSAKPIVQTMLTTSEPVLVLRHSLEDPSPPAELRRILVPLDGTAASAQALSAAATMARAMLLPVTFLMVIDPARIIPPAFAYDPEAWSLIGSQRQSAHWTLRQAEEQMLSAGIAADSLLMLGSTSATIQSHIEKTDLVIMSTHGPGTSGFPDRESVTLTTLANSPQPMLLFRAKEVEPVVVDSYPSCSWVVPWNQGEGVSG